MLSDIHFDPFHDPGKFAQLNAAPAEKWHDILAAPMTATQPADFAALEKACKVKGTDTPFPLFDSALKAAHTQLAAPLFVTVSGDLMTHKFDCLYHTLAPTATEADYSAFAAKTVAFVTLSLERTFPTSPVYITLGNNDSGCKDYNEDADSSFLKTDAQTFAAAARSRANSAAYLAEFAHEGDANLLLPAPFKNTHLLVLQDVFESRSFALCSGTASDAPEKAQIAWLRAQLTAAQAAHEHVWILAHIPPGIDPYSTFTKAKDGEMAPQMFLDSEAFAKTIADFPDTIALVLLGHTHMDEMRSFAAAGGKTVPGKLVPSITPVNGNNPSFTVAEVSPATSTLKDYVVYAATNQAASNWETAPTWSGEYRYSTTYHLPDFSAASVAKLTAGFLADKTGSGPDSQSYQKFYVAGDMGPGSTLKAKAMQLVWPIYTCSMTQTTKAGFSACLATEQPARQ